MNYELTIVLPGGTTAAKKKAAVARIDKLVKLLKGKVANSKEWGEMELAYPVSGNTSGVFVYFELQLSPDSAPKLTEKLRVEKDFIRYLLVKSA